ncbi:hypothetical protein GCM10009087_02100 [Sphingomonas oligophenolica]
MFEAAFHAAVIGKAIVAVTGHIVEANASLAAMLGRAPEALRGMHFADFTHPHDIQADLHLFDEVMHGARDSYQLEKRYLRCDGATVHVLLSTTVVREDNGTPIQFISEIIDLSESRRVGIALEEANAKLRRQVITDHLTGLYNRRGFEDALAAVSPGETASLLLVDLDDFKAVNDRLGHEAGDLVLAEVGRRLLGLVSRGDCVARVGGDEFSIILAGAGAELAQETAARVVGHLGAVFHVGGDLVHIGASVGAACSDPNCATPRGLKAKADAALYAAKRAGRGTWQLAD